MATVEPEEIAQAIARPGTEYRRIPANHVSHRQQPARFVSAVLDFASAAVHLRKRV